MSGQINEARVREWVASAERAYTSCWQTLVSLKAQPRQIDPSKLFSFQPTLAEAIHALDRGYDEIRAAEKALIASKHALPREDFRKQIAELARLREVVKETGSIGRGLGDAFAWLFYLGSPELVSRQVVRPRPGNTAPGLGGRGELAFVRTFPKFKHYFPIYHGVTTFLRSGDFTLVDARTFKVAGLIELKTKRADGEVFDFSVNLVGSQKIDDLMEGFTMSAEKPKLPPAPPPVPGFQDHLRRQMKTMGTVLADEPPHGKANVNNAYHIEELRALSEALKGANAAFQQAGPGLLLMGVNLPAMGLAERLVKGEMPFDVPATFPDLASLTMKLMRTDSKLNSIIISRLDVAPIPGGTPLFWWPVDAEFLRKIYFRELYVGSIFNPAHLAHKLIDRGFEINAKGRPERWSAHKRVGDFKAELESFAYFVWAIQYHLMREEAALETVERVLAEAQLRPNSRVQMNISHMMM